MNWRFWEPKHTVASVAKRISEGLRDGTVVLGEPLSDDPFTDDIEEGRLVLQFDVAPQLSADEILDLVKECVRNADEQDRNHGGPGLNLEAVRVESPKVKVALRNKEAATAR